MIPGLKHTFLQSGHRRCISSIPYVAEFDVVQNNLVRQRFSSGNGIVLGVARYMRIRVFLIKFPHCSPSHRVPLSPEYENGCVVVGSDYLLSWFYPGYSSRHAEDPAVFRNQGCPQNKNPFVLVITELIIRRQVR